MRKETPWGTWDHISLDKLLGLLSDLNAPWWIAGGYAIDAFAGGGRREHDDIDFGAFASDQLAIFRYLDGWQLHYGGDPSGTLKPWRSGELPRHVHDIWARRDPSDAWRFQLMLNPGTPSEFIYRRDERIRLPLDEATVSVDGVRYLTPELQLLFKSRSPREKDDRDLADCLRLLNARQRAWLGWALQVAEPESRWRTLL